MPGGGRLNPGDTLRVLFVADTPFAPVIAGDAARLARLVDLFRDHGWAVDFALFDDPQRRADDAAMRRACDHLEICRGSPEEHALRQGPHLDDWCVPRFAKTVADMVAERRPDVLWAHFVYHSRVLLGPSNACRPVTVIDADNVFTGRREGIERAGVAYDWFSTTAAEELRGLRRADLVVAIHEGEAATYRAADALLDVVVVPYAPPLRLLPPASTKTLVFLGARNPENEAGLRDFVDNAWPIIRAANPDAVLRVVGSVGAALMPGDGIVLEDYVANPAMIWADAAIGLNTTSVGTGLKIKSVDTLAHGRPLVSTTVGADGLEAFDGAVLIADNAPTFARTINALLSDPVLLATATAAAQGKAAALLDPERIFAPIERRLRAMVGARRAAEVTRRR
ncbi:hypothetical protein AVM11_11980 [Sphingomonas melonis TY]|uniref:Glycosyltransferase subfamily 4-like N-terminal domain-containing protein n=1 Tax=Sphingomonas melonis TY TaxID=621456 RepID=A0A175XZB3_9SPHN|nr:glycosyltransferase [Sphingomonas melonis]KZB93579.1 hypothetical protein AVM11_11980 [Sphingomonas melonis TY]